jgi:hypothetical protein
MAMRWLKRLGPSGVMYSPILHRTVGTFREEAMTRQEFFQHLQHRPTTRQEAYHLSEIYSHLFRKAFHNE